MDLGYLMIFFISLLIEICMFFRDATNSSMSKKHHHFARLGKKTMHLEAHYCKL